VRGGELDGTRPILPEHLTFTDTPTKEQRIASLNLYIKNLQAALDQVNHMDSETLLESLATYTKIN
jgi:hypothetical protein